VRNLPATPPFTPAILYRPPMIRNKVTKSLGGENGTAAANA
jgi:hypothetical protein